MKKIGIPLLLVITIIACSTTKKTAPAPKVPATENTPAQTGQTAEVFRVKILRKSCASLVAQVMDEAWYSYGEEWAPFNVRIKEPYKNALTIANKCIVPDDVPENSIIKVKIVTAEEANKKPCMACMMMDYPPAKQIHIKYLGLASDKKG